jgi:hypothetical protein
MKRDWKALTIQLWCWLKPRIALVEAITLAGMDHLVRRRVQQLDLPALPPSESTAIETITVTVTEALSPTERELVTVAETAAQLMVVEQKPRRERAALVDGLLDEAWSQGLTTYPELIAYVKANTGEACSRRAIANWKRKRGLLDQVEQAA